MSGWVLAGVGVGVSGVSGWVLVGVGVGVSGCRGGC